MHKNLSDHLKNFDEDLERLRAENIALKNELQSHRDFVLVVGRF